LTIGEQPSRFARGSNVWSVRREGDTKTCRRPLSWYGRSLRLAVERSAERLCVRLRARISVYEGVAMRVFHVCDM
jgi:hypothetical protein